MASTNYTPNHVEFLDDLNLVSSTLSVVGSLWMSYYCVKSSLTNISYRLILGIGLSDFFYSISNILTAFESPTPNTLCTVEAIMRMCFFNMSLLWATSTAILCYKALKRGRRFDQALFFKKAFVINTSIPLIIAFM